MRSLEKTETVWGQNLLLEEISTETVATQSSVCLNPQLLQMLQLLLLLQLFLQHKQNLQLPWMTFRSVSWRLVVVCVLLTYRLVSCWLWCLFTWCVALTVTVKSSVSRRGRQSGTEQMPRNTQDNNNNNNNNNIILFYSSSYSLICYYYLLYIYMINQIIHFCIIN